MAAPVSMLSCIQTVRVCRTLLALKATLDADADVQADALCDVGGDTHTSAPHLPLSAIVDVYAASTYPAEEVEDAVHTLFRSIVSYAAIPVVGSIARFLHLLPGEEWSSRALNVYMRASGAFAEVAGQGGEVQLPLAHIYPHIMPEAQAAANTVENHGVGDTTMPMTRGSGEADTHHDRADSQRRTRTPASAARARVRHALERERMRVLGVAAPLMSLDAVPRCVQSVFDSHVNPAAISELVSLLQNGRILPVVQVHHGRETHEADDVSALSAFLTASRGDDSAQQSAGGTADGYLEAEAVFAALCTAWHAWEAACMASVAALLRPFGLQDLVTLPRLASHADRLPASDLAVLAAITTSGKHDSAAAALRIFGMGEDDTVAALLAMIPQASDTPFGRLTISLPMRMPAGENENTALRENLHALALESAILTQLGARIVRRIVRVLGMCCSYDSRRSGLLSAWTVLVCLANSGLYSWQTVQDTAVAADSARRQLYRIVDAVALGRSVAPDVDVCCSASPIPVAEYVWRMHDGCRAALQSCVLPPASSAPSQNVSVVYSRALAPVRAQEHEAEVLSQRLMMEPAMPRVSNETSPTPAPSVDENWSRYILRAQPEPHSSLAAHSAFVGAGATPDMHDHANPPGTRATEMPDAPMDYALIISMLLCECCTRLQQWADVFCWCATTITQPHLPEAGIPHAELDTLVATAQPLLPSFAEVAVACAGPRALDTANSAFGESVARFIATALPDEDDSIQLSFASSSAAEFTLAARRPWSARPTAPPPIASHRIHTRVPAMELSSEPAESAGPRTRSPMPRQPDGQRKSNIANPRPPSAVLRFATTLPTALKLQYEHALHLLRARDAQAARAAVTAIAAPPACPEQSVLDQGQLVVPASPALLHTAQKLAARLQMAAGASSADADASSPSTYAAGIERLATAAAAASTSSSLSAGMPCTSPSHALDGVAPGQSAARVGNSNVMSRHRDTDQHQRLDNDAPLDLDPILRVAAAPTTSIHEHSVRAVEARTLHAQYSQFLESVSVERARERAHALSCVATNRAAAAAEARRLAEQLHALREYDRRAAAALREELQHAIQQAREAAAMDTERKAAFFRAAWTESRTGRVHNAAPPTDRLNSSSAPPDHGSLLPGHDAAQDASSASGAAAGLALDAYTQAHEAAKARRAFAEVSKRRAAENAHAYAVHRQQTVAALAGDAAAMSRAHSTRDAPDSPEPGSRRQRRFSSRFNEKLSVVQQAVRRVSDHGMASVSDAIAAFGSNTPFEKPDPYDYVRAMVDHTGPDLRHHYTQRRGSSSSDAAPFYAYAHAFVPIHAATSPASDVTAADSDAMARTRALGAASAALFDALQPSERARGPRGVVATRSSSSGLFSAFVGSGMLPPPRNARVSRASSALASSSSGARPRASALAPATDGQSRSSRLRVIAAVQHARIEGATTAAAALEATTISNATVVGPREGQPSEQLGHPKHTGQTSVHAAAPKPVPRDTRMEELEAAYEATEVVLTAFEASDGDVSAARASHGQSRINDMLAPDGNARTTTRATAQSDRRPSSQHIRTASSPATSSRSNPPRSAHARARSVGNSDRSRTVEITQALPPPLVVDRPRNESGGNNGGLPRPTSVPLIINDLGAQIMPGGGARFLQSPGSGTVRKGAHAPGSRNQHQAIHVTDMQIVLPAPSEDIWNRAPGSDDSMHRSAQGVESAHVVMHPRARADLGEARRGTTSVVGKGREESLDVVGLAAAPLSFSHQADPAEFSPWQDLGKDLDSLRQNSASMNAPSPSKLSAFRRSSGGKGAHPQQLAVPPGASGHHDNSVSIRGSTQVPRRASYVDAVNVKGALSCAQGESTGDVTRLRRGSALATAPNPSPECVDNASLIVGGRSASVSPGPPPSIPDVCTTEEASHVLVHRRASAASIPVEPPQAPDGSGVLHATVGGRRLVGILPEEAARRRRRSSVASLPPTSDGWEPVSPFKRRPPPPPPRELRSRVPPPPPARNGTAPGHTVGRAAGASEAARVDAAGVESMDERLTGAEAKVAQMSTPIAPTTASGFSVWAEESDHLAPQTRDAMDESASFGSQTARLMRKAAGRSASQYAVARPPSAQLPSRASERRTSLKSSMATRQIDSSLNESVARSPYDSGAQQSHSSAAVAVVGHHASTQRRASASGPALEHGGRVRKHSADGGKDEVPRGNASRRHRRQSESSSETGIARFVGGDLGAAARSAYRDASSRGTQRLRSRQRPRRGRAGTDETSDSSEEDSLYSSDDSAQMPRTKRVGFHPEPQPRERPPLTSRQGTPLSSARSSPSSDVQASATHRDRGTPPLGQPRLVTIDMSAELLASMSPSRSATSTRAAVVPSLALSQAGAFTRAGGMQLHALPGDVGKLRHTRSMPAMSHGALFYAETNNAAAGVPPLKRTLTTMYISAPGFQESTHRSTTPVSDFATGHASARAQSTPGRTPAGEARPTSRGVGMVYIDAPGQQTTRHIEEADAISSWAPASQRDDAAIPLAAPPRASPSRGGGGYGRPMTQGMRWLDQQADPGSGSRDTAGQKKGRPPPPDIDKEIQQQADAVADAMRSQLDDYVANMIEEEDEVLSSSAPAPAAVPQSKQRRASLIEAAAAAFQGASRVGSFSDADGLGRRAGRRSSTMSALGRDGQFGEPTDNDDDGIAGIESLLLSWQKEGAEAAAAGELEDDNFPKLPPRRPARYDDGDDAEYATIDACVAAQQDELAKERIIASTAEFRRTKSLRTIFRSGQLAPWFSKTVVELLPASRYQPPEYYRMQEGYSEPSGKEPCEPGVEAAPTRAATGPAVAVRFSGAETAAVPGADTTAVTSVLDSQRSHRRSGEAKEAALAAVGPASTAAALDRQRAFGVFHLEFDWLMTGAAADVAMALAQDQDAVHAPDANAAGDQSDLVDPRGMTANGLAWQDPFDPLDDECTLTEELLRKEASEAAEDPVQKRLELAGVLDADLLRDPLQHTAVLRTYKLPWQAFFDTVLAATFRGPGLMLDDVQRIADLTLADTMIAAPRATAARPDAARTTSPTRRRPQLTVNVPATQDASRPAEGSVLVSSAGGHRAGSPAADVVQFLSPSMAELSRRVRSRVAASSQALQRTEKYENWEARRQPVDEMERFIAAAAADEQLPVFSSRGSSSHRHSHMLTTSPSSGDTLSHAQAELPRKSVTQSAIEMRAAVRAADVAAHEHGASRIRKERMLLHALLALRPELAPVVQPHSKIRDCVFFRMDSEWVERIQHGVAASAGDRRAPSNATALPNPQQRGAAVSQGHVDACTGVEWRYYRLQVPRATMEALPGGIEPAFPMRLRVVVVPTATSSASPPEGHLRWSTELDLRLERMGSHARQESTSVIELQVRDSGSSPVALGIREAQNSISAELFAAVHALPTRVDHAWSGRRDASVVAERHAVTSMAGNVTLLQQARENALADASDNAVGLTISPHDRDYVHDAHAAVRAGIAEPQGEQRPFHDALEAVLQTAQACVDPEMSTQHQGLGRLPSSSTAVFSLGGNPLEPDVRDNEVVAEYIIGVRLQLASIWDTFKPLVEAFFRANGRPRSAFATARPDALDLRVDFELVIGCSAPPRPTEQEAALALAHPKDMHDDALGILARSDKTPMEHVDAILRKFARVVHDFHEEHQREHALVQDVLPSGVSAPQRARGRIQPWQEYITRSPRPWTASSATPKALEPTASSTAVSSPTAKSRLVAAVLERVSAAGTVRRSRIASAKLGTAAVLQAGEHDEDEVTAPGPAGKQRMPSVVVGVDARAPVSGAGGTAPPREVTWKVDYEFAPDALLDRRLGEPRTRTRRLSTLEGIQRRSGGAAQFDMDGAEQSDESAGVDEALRPTIEVAGDDGDRASAIATDFSSTPTSFEVDDLGRAVLDRGGDPTLRSTSSWMETHLRSAGSRNGALFRVGSAMSGLRLDFAADFVQAPAQSPRAALAQYFATVLALRAEDARALIEEAVAHLESGDAAINPTPEADATASLCVQPAAQPPAGGHSAAVHGSDRWETDAAPKHMPPSLRDVRVAVPRRLLTSLGVPSEAAAGLSCTHTADRARPLRLNPLPASRRPASQSVDPHSAWADAVPRPASLGHSQSAMLLSAGAERAEPVQAGRLYAEMFSSASMTQLGPSARVADLVDEAGRARRTRLRELKRVLKKGERRARDICLPASQISVSSSAPALADRGALPGAHRVERDGVAPNAAAEGTAAAGKNRTLKALRGRTKPRGDAMAALLSTFVRDGSAPPRY